MEDKLFDDILKSNKYSFLDEGLIKRVIKEEIPKYKKYKDILQSVKNKLHIIYGSFITDKFYEKAKKLIDTDEIYKLHSSTSERYSFYEEFYNFIFKNIKGNSVIDLGCGFNPFSIKLQNGINEYYAYDIDKRISELINYYFNKNNIKGVSNTIDLITSIPDVKADIAYMFKLLPVLENEKKGRSIEIIDNLNVKYIVITYPIKSLSGRNKNMKENYTNDFYNIIGDKYKVIDSACFHNEIVFIIEK